MTVQELIDELEKIEDKTLPVGVQNPEDIDYEVCIDVLPDKVVLW